MANNKFVNLVKSAIFVTDENEQPKQEAKVEVPKVQEVKTDSEANTNENVIELNQQILDKLCERLDMENLPGPDYMELRTTMNSDYLVKNFPDENTRMNIAFNTLKVTSPQLTKEYIMESIDTYIGFLHQWRSEAINEVSKKREEVNASLKKIEDLNAKIEKMTKERDSLQLGVNEITEKCDRNQRDMDNAITFLISKLGEDKENITKNLN